MKMTKREFMLNFGDTQVRFQSFSNFSFFLIGKRPSGESVKVIVGGSPERIANWEVNVFSSDYVHNLDIIVGRAFDKEGNEIGQYFEN